jgi:flagellar biogenesis protein FliO
MHRTSSALSPALAVVCLLAVVSATVATAAERPEEKVRLPFRIVRVVRGGETVPAVGKSVPLPLAPPKRKAGSGTTPASPLSPSRAVSTVATSLLIVGGAFLLLIWFARRKSGRGTVSLPQDVIETLGRAPLSGRQEMHLVRVGNKLLLLSVTPTSAETLTEITDAVEIERLSRICQQNQPGCISATFRDVLSQLNRQPRAGYHA